jgi:methyl-accepting chemotaxis protein
MVEILSNLSIKKKAFAASIVLWLCLIGLGANAYLTLRDSARGLEIYSSVDLPNQRFVSDLKNDIIATHINIFRYVTWASSGVNKQLVDAQAREIDSGLRSTRERLQDLAGRPGLPPAERSLADDLSSTWERYTGAAKDTVDIGTSDTPMATMMLGAVDDNFHRVAEALEKVSDVLAERGRTATDDLATNAEANKRVLAIGGTIGIVFSILVTILVAHSIVGPIRSVTAAMKRISGGNIDVDIGYRARRDEIGEMVEAIEVFRKNAVHMRAMELAAREAEQRRVSERKSDMHTIASEFEGSVKHITVRLTDLANVVHGQAQKMSAAAHETCAKSQITAEIVVQTTGNVQAVAKSADALSASIKELARTTSHASTLASATAADTEGASSEIERLSNAVNQIMSIVGLIQGIARQTNLLALNATIEAARAGAVGKGFSVVAAEVKSLAQQTSRATDDITRKIEAVRGSCSTVVSTINHIFQSIQQLRSCAVEMSSAIDQQAAATAAISENAQLAASGSRAVADNVVVLKDKAHETDKASSYVLEEARHLFEHVEAVGERVDGFLHHVTAG